MGVALTTYVKELIAGFCVPVPWRHHQLGQSVRLVGRFEATGFQHWDELGLSPAGMSVVESNNTFFAARYRRVATSRGNERGLVAVQRAMLTAVWHVLRTGQPHHDLGPDYYAKRRPGTIIAKALNRLRAAGINVTLTTTTEAVVT